MVSPRTSAGRCYEGTGRQGGYDGASLDSCESLYSRAGQTPPFHAYRHDANVAANDGCPAGSSSISGLAFEDGSNYLADYDGALFFADASRGCIWVMKRGGAEPSPSQLSLFVGGAGAAVQLASGPGGDIFYVDLDGGELHRVTYNGANHPPTAVIKASPTSGESPLNVAFDGSDSHDLDAGDRLTYAWDLDGDGQFDDSTGATTAYTYTAEGTVTDCHTHPVQGFEGVASGSFPAPDHEYPSSLTLELTATDAAGASARTSVTLDPRTVDLTFATEPKGLQLTVGPDTVTAPATRRVIVGSSNGVSAASPQSLDGTSYYFDSWSDGGAPTHNVVAPASPSTYTATFRVPTAGCPTSPSYTYTIPGQGVRPRPRGCLATAPRSQAWGPTAATT